MTDDNNIATGEICASKSWFARRPIPVFIISTLCILQFLGIVLYISDHWSETVELVRIGEESPAMFLFKMLYPFLLLSAGLAFLFLRKIAVIFFGIYFAWGLQQAIAQTVDFPGYLSLALVFCTIVYSLRLKQRGVLK